MISRRARRLVRATVALAAIAAVLVTVGCAVLSLPQFGASMAGTRLARALANPQYADGRFVNLEPEAPSTTSLLDYTLRQLSGDEVREPPAPLPVLAVDKAALAAAPASSGLRAFWIGHASAYVEADGVRFLLDPVFAERVSPLPVGPRRFHAPPIALADLPPIDAVLISHDHYDHLDMDTVRQLARGGTRFFVGLGIGAYLQRWGVPLAQIQEMDWWEKAEFRGVEIHSTPARHYSGRKSMDDSTLWSSWMIKSVSYSVYYSGDTGYGPHFGEIRKRLGVPDLVLMKVGAYGHSWLDIHMDPESAVQAQRDLGSTVMLPVHWATFNMSYHAWAEPIERTLAAAQGTDVQVVTPRVGEPYEFGHPVVSQAWFRRP